jgi:hypothetical protein
VSDGWCEACRLAPAVDTIPDQDADPPYRLCAPCARRLRSFSLRPLEWFNLAAVHGPLRFHLHDDFYWEGRAEQPEEPVKDPERYLLPTLKGVRDNLERLLDYATTRYSLMGEEAVLAALDAYLERDNVPNARRRIAFLRRLWEDRRVAQTPSP